MDIFWQADVEGGRGIVHRAGAVAQAPHRGGGRVQTVGLLAVPVIEHHVARHLAHEDVFLSGQRSH